jgi:hypothetical protein
MCKHKHCRVTHRTLPQQMAENVVMTAQHWSWPCKTALELALQNCTGVGLAKLHWSWLCKTALELALQKQNQARVTLCKRIALQLQSRALRTPTSRQSVQDAAPNPYKTLHIHRRPPTSAVGRWQVGKAVHHVESSTAQPAGLS